MLSWPTLTPLMRTRSALPGKEAENTARAYYRRGTSLPSPRHHRHRQSIPRTTRSASGRGRERQFRLVGKLDVDLKRRDIPSSLHADDNLLRIERNMARHGGKNLFAQEHQKVGLAAHPAFMREQNLQPFRRTRCR